MFTFLMFIHQCISTRHQFVDGYGAIGFFVSDTDTDRKMVIPASTTIVQIHLLL